MVIEVDADPVYQTVLLQVERIFWRCLSTGEVPVVYGAVPPKLKRPIVRVVDMSASNVWSECAAIFARTRKAHAEHEAAKSELKLLGPEDAREVFGHGVRAKRSGSGAIRFDMIPMQATMRASSDTLAQLAAAMAKAQSELVNPAKSLTAVLERGRNGAGPQNYRYAPLSSGLDIVRKAFGKCALALIQTTHVDRERSLVLLTTTTAHSSGEWISGLWANGCCA